VNRRSRKRAGDPKYLLVVIRSSYPCPAHHPLRASLAGIYISQPPTSQSSQALGKGNELFLFTLIASPLSIGKEEAFYSYSTKMCKDNASHFF
jgi:hypothetical protein